MNNWYPVFWANLLNWRKQSRGFFISGLLKPLFYLMIFNLGIGRRIAIEGSDYLNFIIPGLLTMIVVNHSFTDVVSWFTLRKNSYRVLDFYLLSPNSVWSFLLGNTVASVLKSILGTVLLILVINFFTVKLNFSFGVFLSIASLAFTFSSLASIVSILSNSERDTIAVSNLVVTPMTFLCGTFFPLERLPLFLQYLAWLSPITPGVYTLRSLLLGYSINPLLVSIVSVWTAASFALAGYFLTKKDV